MAACRLWSRGARGGTTCERSTFRNHLSVGAAVAPRRLGIMLRMTFKVRTSCASPPNHVQDRSPQVLVTAVATNAAQKHIAYPAAHARFQEKHARERPGGIACVRLCLATSSKHSHLGRSGTCGSRDGRHVTRAVLGAPLG